MGLGLLDPILVGLLVLVVVGMAEMQESALEPSKALQKAITSWIWPLRRRDLMGVEGRRNL